MIPGLPSVGGLELIILLLIILLFFGAKRLPQMGRSLGHGLKEFRKGISGAAEEDNDEVRDRKEEDHPSLNGAARSEELSYAEKENEREAARSTELNKP